MSEEPISARNRPTRVALAMLTLVPVGMGGSERYARALTRELGGQPDLEVTAVVPRAARGFSEMVPEEVVEAVSSGGSTRARLIGLVQAQRAGRHTESLRRADVVHFPFSVPVPSQRGAPFVQTIHDVQHLDLPELFSRQEILYRRQTYDRGARRAATVITVSEFTKDRLVATLGIDPAKIVVAHLGIDPPLRGPSTGGREDFVLYPARGWRHKNHARLLRAMDLVRRKRPTMRLVLTGGGLDSLGAVPDWVDIRGHVGDAELEALYRRASCLAFPSLYEGFGLPPLEAMARGCPVAVAREGALPEVCQDAAIFFDPHAPGAIARGIDEAIEGRDRLVERGLRRAAQFSWKTCAQIHAQVYRLPRQRSP